jgi:uncharacterized protein YecT (DUF1311 family)
MSLMRAMRVVQTHLLFLMVFLSFATYAMGQHMNAEDAPCHGPSSNAEETQCFISASRNADTEMNQTYDRVRKVLGADEQEQLQSVQRLWMRFRDANCAAERDLYRGGTAAPMVYAACIEADARQRSAELNTIYGWRLIKFGRGSDK